jgi:hypothetical protein
MYMTIEMNPAIEVVSVTRNRIVAQNNVIAVNLKFLVIADFVEQAADTLISQQLMIVVANAEVLLTVQTAENLNRLCGSIPTEIAQDPNFIILTDN